VSEEDAVNILLEALSRQPAAADDKAEEVYAVETARAIFRDAERTSDSEEQGEITKWAMRSHSAERIKAMCFLVKHQLGVKVEEFDADPYLLNVQNGTIDLRTGKLKDHDPADRLTKLANVTFDPAAKAPRFQKFIKQVLVDPELIAFTQRFLGYSLTGSPKERAMAVLHGVGKNGKSTLVELFQDLLGEYAATTSPDTVMQQKYSSTREYALAELAGVRFIAIAETKRGSELDEAVVKQVTGGDTISARPIYGKPFAYRPQFTIWMSTNHKPEIPDGSEAIWDRLKLIPFTQRFDGNKADTSLPQELREELSGVLTWAVRGCIDWFANGLGTSKAVKDATAKYREDTDVHERFISDMCQIGPDRWEWTKDLFTAWEAWCLDEGEDPRSQKDFTTKMKERGVVKGFEWKRNKKSSFWAGISLSDENDTPPKSPAKHGGVVDSVYRSSEFAKGSLGHPSRREPLEKTEKRYIDTPDEEKRGRRTFTFEGESE
jgi:putative DNA primase/helicase